MIAPVTYEFVEAIEALYHANSPEKRHRAKQRIDAAMRDLVREFHPDPCEDCATRKFHTPVDDDPRQEGYAITFPDPDFENDERADLARDEDDHADEKDR